MPASAIDSLRHWREDPRVFVREVLGATPDAWQDQVLAEFPRQRRIALKSCKGPGKTSLLAWLSWNFLLTRPHPRIAATSITGDNLSDNLWAEMAKWQGKSPLLKSAFTWQKSRIFANEHPETWWMSARSWPRDADPQRQADTLAGLHADYILFVIDESGGIPDAVMAAAEPALSTGIEAHIVQAGNPTMLEGPLYRASTTERRLWYVVEISADPDDPLRSPRVSAQWAREQIEKYGRNNPWVLVNVFGQFPPGSINTLIGPDAIADAVKRYWREDQVGLAPRVLGVDVARFGGDASVIFKRQGIQAFPPLEYRNIDGIQGAGTLVRVWKDWGADAAFIDDTGGWATSWIDHAKMLGKSPIPVGFARQAHDPARYANKRAEMYFDAVQWIRDGGALPECPELAAALSTTTYSYRGDKLLLEDKDQVRERLGYSPDHADGFVLTFAEPVSAPAMRRMGRPMHQFETDPFADFGRMPEHVRALR